MDLKALSYHPAAPKVLVVVLDGIGHTGDASLTLSLQQGNSALPASPFFMGNAVNAAYTPNAQKMWASEYFCTLKAHGAAVGLPSDSDMGNSEVGHNALGSGQITQQGALLIQNALATGALFKGSGWSKIMGSTGTLHLCGLLSDGGVHSHTEHLFALMDAAKKFGKRTVRLHVLLDGRDVGPFSALEYVTQLEAKCASLCDENFDVQVASGGGRMKVTMDRYNCDWSIVQRGYDAHVLGQGQQFATLQEAVVTLRGENTVMDQNLPAFVIAKHGTPVGAVQDGDAFVLFNFRGDRAIQFTQALTQDSFPFFNRQRFPKITFAGMMQYDGDTQLPAIYLVSPPEIKNTMGELLAKAKVPQFACSETQKFGHVTYFWNGNRSEKFDEKSEHYHEITSDNADFSERPWMKSADIVDLTIGAMRQNTFQVGRINLPNGDMVGHTGNFAAAVVAMGCLDLALGRLMQAAKETDTILVVTADHGNADEMYESKNSVVSLLANGSPTLRTSHTLAPVPFAIYNVEAWQRLTNHTLTLDSQSSASGSLSQVAATVLNLAGFQAPDFYSPSLVIASPTKEARATDETLPATRSASNVKITDSEYELGQACVSFARVVSKLRAECPWDRKQTLTSLQRYMIEECYESVSASENLSRDVSSKDAAIEFCDELGDVMLQVFLNAQIASETKSFDMIQIFKAIEHKMIVRHPHVFETGAERMVSAEQVAVQWEKIKETQKKSEMPATTLLQAACKKHALPTLDFCAAISVQSAKLGFCWPTLAEVFQGLKSEIAELETELLELNPDRIQDEIGDVIYTLCNVAMTIDPKMSLDRVARMGIQKFINRFASMEEILRERHNVVSEDFAKQLSLDEWNTLWDEAKRRRYR